MIRKLTIYFICGAGLGSSLACQMTAEDVLNRLGLDENLEHEAISATPGLRTDIIVSAENFAWQFKQYDLDPAIKFVFLHNIVDPDEIEAKLVPVIKELSEKSAWTTERELARLETGACDGRALAIASKVPMWRFPRQWSRLKGGINHGCG